MEEWLRRRYHSSAPFFKGCRPKIMWELIDVQSRDIFFPVGGAVVQMSQTSAQAVPVGGLNRTCLFVYSLKWPHPQVCT